MRPTSVVDRHKNNGKSSLEHVLHLTLVPKLPQAFNLTPIFTEGYSYDSRSVCKLVVVVSENFAIFQLFQVYVKQYKPRVASAVKINTVWIIDLHKDDYKFETE